MILFLYARLVSIAGPLILVYLRRRLARGKEDPARFPERLGQASLARPPGFLIWLHAASVGESVSMLPLIALLQQRAQILVTTGTVTSAAMMAERLPKGAIHHYVPVDRPAWVRRFLDHWRPDLALWAESEFWPNLIMMAAARQVPLILINGRISDRSFARWQYFPGLIGPLLGKFALCLGQTERDADRLRILGACRSLYLGNLKFAAPPLAADPAQLAAFAARLGDRPRWLAASTHDGEEMMAGEIHRALAGEFPSLLTLIAPRHPHRGDDIARALRAAGLRVAQRSQGEMPDDATQIYLADTMGELGIFYRLAKLVFMGKSMTGQGGQNPLEPARLGGSVLFGPHMGNFIDIAERMREAKAAEQLATPSDLVAALRLRLGDPDRVAREGQAAMIFATAEDGVLARLQQCIADWLPAGEEK